jgi:hypothetical protein
MRSGIVHLRKRMDEEREAISTFGPADDEGSRGEITSVGSRLDKPVWSVISFDKLEAGGLTYRQAEELVAALDAEGVAGLCIVTDEAAIRTAG